jgi:DnaJ-class molecular chaperone
MERRKYVVRPLGDNTYENNFKDVCRNCGGTGLINLFCGQFEGTVIMCEVCQGSGEVAITKTIKIVVKPFKREYNVRTEN